jgi:hypothetical protein
MGYQLLVVDTLLAHMMKMRMTVFQNMEVLHRTVLVVQYTVAVITVRCPVLVVAELEALLERDLEVKWPVHQEAPYIVGVVRQAVSGHLALMGLPQVAQH